MLGWAACAAAGWEGELLRAEEPPPARALHRGDDEGGASARGPRPADSMLPLSEDRQCQPARGRGGGAGPPPQLQHQHTQHQAPALDAAPHTRCSCSTWQQPAQLADARPCPPPSSHAHTGCDGSGPAAGFHLRSSCRPATGAWDCGALGMHGDLRRAHMRVGRGRNAGMESARLRPASKPQPHWPRAQGMKDLSLKEDAGGAQRSAPLQEEVRGRIPCSGAGQGRDSRGAKVSGQVDRPVPPTTPPPRPPPRSSSRAT